VIRVLRNFSAMVREVGLPRTVAGAARSIIARISNRRSPAYSDPGPPPGAAESLTTLDSHGATFIVRTGSCDAGIIEETWQSYMSWIDEVGIDTSEYVLDLGAHIGGFSLHLAAHRRPPRRIYALEPEPTNFMLLRKNVAQNDCEQTVIAIPAAAYSRDGTAQLHLSSGTSGGHHISLGRSGVHVEVETRDIRGIVDGIHGQISLMKIDVEGWELPILRRLGDRVARVNAIIGEAHTTYFCTPPSLFRHLSDLGFVVRSRGPAEMPIFLATRHL